jgi:AraC-like DNA-binding protein
LSTELRKGASLFVALYYYLRGSIGFSLIVGGISLRLSHGKEQGLRAFGLLYVAVGALISMSALDPILELPVDLDNLLYQGFMCFGGLSIVDIALFLFGSEQRSGGRSTLRKAGIAYGALLVILPFLDYALRLEPGISNVEDSLIRAPIHAAAIQAAYIWPIAASIAATLIARWKPSDISGEHAETRQLRLSLVILCAFIAATLLGLLFSWRAFYRVGHLVLDLLLLAGYFYVVAHPRTLMRMRIEIGQEHAKRLLISDEESALIEKRLAAIAEKPQAVFDENFDLRRLAALVGVPPYRLSTYFGSKAGLSFPVWRNRLRIDYVRSRMAERPDLTILEISVEAGYRSKTSLNEQFARIVGTSPSEYRRSLKRGGEKGRPVL